MICIKCLSKTSRSILAEGLAEDIHVFVTDTQEPVYCYKCWQILYNHDKIKRIKRRLDWLNPLYRYDFEKNEFCRDIIDYHYKWRSLFREPYCLSCRCHTHPLIGETACSDNFVTVGLNMERTLQNIILSKLKSLGIKQDLIEPDNKRRFYVLDERFEPINTQRYICVSCFDRMLRLGVYREVEYIECYGCRRHFALQDAAHTNCRTQYIAGDSINSMDTIDTDAYNDRRCGLSITGGYYSRDDGGVYRFTEQYLKSHPDLPDLVAKGKKVLFCNGCVDKMHNLNEITWVYNKNY